MPKFTIGLGKVSELTGSAAVQFNPSPKGLLGFPSRDLSQIAVVSLGDGQVDPNTVQESSPSKETYHATTFESFRLHADPTYNFFTRDERTAFDSDVSASLDQLPRYVTLTWRVAPLRGSAAVGTKATRRFIGSIPAQPPVVPLDVAVASAANGYIMPGTVSAIVTPPPAPPPPPRLDEDSFLLDPDAGGQMAAQHVGDSESRFTFDVSSARDVVKVRFVDPSIAGALTRERISLATDDVHLNVVASLAKVASGLEIISEFNQDSSPVNPPPTFPAPLDTPVVSYVGYVIERHDLAPDGTMTLGRRILIDDSGTGYYVDREVVYEGSYAYRIRTVVQWTHDPTVTFSGPTGIDRLTPTDQVVGSKVVSYYLGDWSDWERTSIVDTVPPNPPDELTVMPVSRRSEVRVAWKMPGDPQRDIDRMVLLRATVEAGTSSDWRVLQTFAPGNGQYVDRDVRPFAESNEEYIYAMYSQSIHGELSVLGEQVMARVQSHKDKHEHPLVRVAPPGGSPSSHPSLGDGLESTHLNPTKRVRIYCRSGKSSHPLRDRDYVLDIRSLSTGERVQVDLNVDSTEIIQRDA